MSKISSNFLSKKIGISKIFLKNGKSIVVTLLLMKKNNILTTGKQKLICSFVCKSKSTNKSNCNLFCEKKITSRKKIIHCNSNISLNSVEITNLNKGQILNIDCVPKGKKYMGAIKKYKFSGLESTHGVSLKHRSIGSTGQCQDPGRVFKGKKMSGRKKRNLVNLKKVQVLDVNNSLHIFIIKGSIPGNILSDIYVEPLI